MDTSIRMTPKQMAIMVVVLAGNGVTPAGEFVPVDLDELIQRIPYKTTKDSMHFSIRALGRRNLVLKGAIEHRRGRGRVTLFPTQVAKTALTRVPVSFVEPLDSEDLVVPQVIVGDSTT